MLEADRSGLKTHSGICGISGGRAGRETAPKQTQWSTSNTLLAAPCPSISVFAN